MNSRTIWPSLEVFKVLCILGMIFVHSTFWLLTENDQSISLVSPVLKVVFGLSVLGVFPLAIPTISGASYGMRNDVSDPKQMFKVALLLCFLNFLMNFCSWGFESPFEWDVLPFIGVSYLVVATLNRYLGSKAVYVASVLVFSLTSVLRNTLPTEDSLLKNILVGANHDESFWPFFPWFATVGFGYGLARFRNVNPSEQQRALSMILVGISALAISVFLGGLKLKLNPENIWGPGVFQPSSAFLLGLVGFSSLLLGILDLAPITNRLANTHFNQSFSNGILWIYIIHTVIGVHVSHRIRSHLDFSIGFPLLFFGLVLFSWGIGSLALHFGTKTVKITLRKAA